MATDADILAANRTLAGALRAKEVARARELTAHGELSAAQAALQRSAQAVTDAQAALHRLLGSMAAADPKPVEPSAPPPVTAPKPDPVPGTAPPADPQPKKKR